MIKFIVKRTIQSALVMWGIVTAVFLMRFMSPGDTISFIVPVDASPEVREAIARDLGLHRPLYEQYALYIFNLLQGDMGYSYIQGTAVTTRVFTRLPATIELAVAATIVGIIIAIPLGVISATRRQEPSDYAATTFSLVGISTPNFWLGIMLILIVSVELGLFPSSRRPIGLIPALELMIFSMDTTGLRQWFLHITLPAITLGTYLTALLTRLTRSGMLEELGKPYVQAARAKGIPESLVLYKHALRNSLVPVLTILGLQFGTLMGGAVITEAVFDWPGLGTLILDAINSRDWPIIQGSLIVVGAAFVLTNSIVDIIHAYVDPQVIHE